MPGSSSGGSSGGSSPGAVHTTTAGEFAGVTSKPTPASGDIILIEDSAATNSKKRITVGSLPSGGGGTAPGWKDVRDYGAALNGTTDDGPAIRAARTALAGGPGVVYIPPGTLRINTTELVGGFTVGCSFEDRQWLVGSGRGSVRSGSGSSRGTTTIFGDGTSMDALLMWRSSSGTPDWRGSGGYGFHVMDNSTNNNTITNGILCQALNNLLFRDVSGGNFLKALGGFMKIIQATNGQPTQYGELGSFDIHNCKRGIWIDGNNPDWVIHHGKIQRPSSTLDVGSQGIYATTNKLDLHDLAIQFYDICIELNSNADNRAKHIRISDIHLEGDSGAASGSYAHGIKFVGTSGQKEMPLIRGIDIGSSGKFSKAISMTNITDYRLYDIRRRDVSWMLRTDTLLESITSTGTIDGVTV